MAKRTRKKRGKVNPFANINNLMRWLGKKSEGTKEAEKKVRRTMRKPDPLKR